MCGSIYVNFYVTYSLYAMYTVGRGWLSFLHHFSMHSSTPLLSFVFFRIPCLYCFVMILDIIGCEISIEPSIHSSSVYTKVGFLNVLSHCRPLLTCSTSIGIRKSLYLAFFRLLGVPHLVCPLVELPFLAMTFFLTLWPYISLGVVRSHRLTISKTFKINQHFKKGLKYHK